LKLQEDGVFWKTSPTELWDLIITDHIDEIKKSAIMGAKVGGGLSTIGSAVSAPFDARKINKAKVQEKSFEELGKNIGEMELPKNLPEQTEKLIKEMGKDGPVKELYVPNLNLMNISRKKESTLKKF